MRSFFFEKQPYNDSYANTSDHTIFLRVTENASEKLLKP